MQQLIASKLKTYFYILYFKLPSVIFLKFYLHFTTTCENFYNVKQGFLIFLFASKTVTSRKNQFYHSFYFEKHTDRSLREEFFFNFLTKEFRLGPSLSGHSNNT